MTGQVGILAFGSLIDHPDIEIEEATICRKHGVRTPFNVEYARRSDKTRAGAPTLVPVTIGGSPIEAQLLVLNVCEQEAKNRLWRRETGRAGKGGHYVEQPNPGPNTLIIDRYENIAGVAVVFAARFPANIDPLGPEELARLAIESARRLRNACDGISYLIDAKRNGIVTPLSPAYESEILQQTGAPNLAAALAKIAAETLRGQRVGRISGA